MRYTTLGCLALVIAGCGGSPMDAPENMVDAAEPRPPYQGFTPMTRSMGLADGDMQVSLTDAVGPIACALSTDQKSGLGTAGHQIILNYSAATGLPCPTGTFAIDSTCPASPDREVGAAVRRGCAYFRQWDATAHLVAVRAASAGAIQISGDEAACTITVELSFDGQAFSDTFTLTDGLAAQPWCSP
ncbi:MAG TPA: hypothetical protein VFT22_32780 [Kofleriaceae bacterium]|nr:hypothetical protein [Kofleriaceae bacterium]